MRIRPPKRGICTSILFIVCFDDFFCNHRQFHFFSVTSQLVPVFTSLTPGNRHFHLDTVTLGPYDQLAVLESRSRTAWRGANFAWGVFGPLCIMVPKLSVKEEEPPGGKVQVLTQFHQNNVFLGGGFKLNMLTSHQYSNDFTFTK